MTTTLPTHFDAVALNGSEPNQSACSAQAAADAPSAIVQRAARVVVVDDDFLSSALQSHLAALLGYDARVEHDANAAIKAVLQDQFDVMLLDLGMPKMDGFEVLATLRDAERRSERRPLPVIAVTGYASEVDRLRCLMAGFNEHLAKPIQATALNDALIRALGGQPVDDSMVAPRPTNHASDADRLRAAVRKLEGVPSDDRSFAPSTTESFAMRSHQLIDALRRALISRDTVDFCRNARALCASGQFLGASRFGQMCEALVDEAGAGRWDQAAERLQAIDFEHQAMLTLLFETPR